METNQRLTVQDLRVTAISILLMGQIAFVSCLGMNPRMDESGRIRILYMGGQFGVSPPCAMMLSDPKMTLSVILTTGYARELEFSERYMRIYFPRNYQNLVDTKDVIVIADSEVDVYVDRHLLWMKNAVLEAGLGLTMGGGACTFGANEPFRSWDDTHVAGVLPVQGVWGKAPGRYSKSVLVKHKILQPENELMRTLPWEEAPAIYPPNVIFPKPGAIVLAESAESWLVPETKNSERIPLMTYWDIGEGRVLAIEDFHSYFSDFYLWRFYPDSVINQHYYAAAVSIPQDPFMMNEIRDNFRQYDYSKRMLFQVLDFVSRFGAKTAPIEMKMDEPDSIRKKAGDLYVQQNYPACSAEINHAIALVDGLIEDSSRLKDKALLWVYTIEWLAVTGTMMISGFVVWSLMIHRRMYREVASTRLQV